MEKVVENIYVNSDCKTNNCLRNKLYNPVEVYSVTYSDYNNPMGGKRELALLIQRSFFANIHNYVTDTIQNCISNHSRSESCTRSCTPLNLSKLNFNFFHLSDKTYFFFLLLTTFVIINWPVHKSIEQKLNYRIPLYSGMLNNFTFRQKQKELF